MNYYKNKNFIPESFRMRKVNQDKHSENKIIALLLIINIVMIPVTVGRIKNINYDKKGSKEIKFEEKRSISMNDILNSFNLISDDSVIEGNIKDNKGTVILTDLNKIKELDNDNNIHVDKFTINDNEDYETEITIDE